MTNDPHTKEGLEVKVTFQNKTIALQNKVIIFLSSVILLFLGEKAAFLKIIAEIAKELLAK